MTRGEAIRLMEPPWKQKALCRIQQLPLELFYPKRGDANKTYRLLRPTCLACEVRRTCLTSTMRHEEGLEHQYRFGFSGGLSPRERANLAGMGRRMTA